MQDDHKEFNPMSELRLITKKLPTHINPMHFSCYVSSILMTQYIHLDVPTLDACMISGNSN